MSLFCIKPFFYVSNKLQDAVNNVIRPTILSFDSLELNFSLIMWKVDCFKLLMQSGAFREMITHPFAQKVNKS